MGRFASIEQELQRLTERLVEVADLALEIAKGHAPVNTGAFEASLDLTTYGQNGFAVISNEPKVLNYLRGTGIYNGGGPIVPRSSPVMVFSRPWKFAPVAPNYGGTWAFRSVAGQQKNPWESEAYNEFASRATGPLGQVMSQVLMDAGFS